MAPPYATLLEVPVFSESVFLASPSSQEYEGFLEYASSSSGSILLSACHAAFHEELSTLTPSELGLLEIRLSDFKETVAVLFQQGKRYRTSLLISSTSQFLQQCLRYLAFVEGRGASNSSLTPFSDVLKRNLQHNVGILGFSSGILSACIVGTSFSSITYISRVVEGYRLLLWINIRSHLTPQSISGITYSSCAFDLDKTCAEEIIDGINPFVDFPLYLTLATARGRIIVSGHPDSLDMFRNKTTAQAVPLDYNLGAYCHSLMGATIRDQVLADIASRGIRFPVVSDIQVPIRSSFTGDLITHEHNSGTLVELALDLILCLPVNLDCVVNKIVDSSPKDSPMHFIDCGHDSDLLRSVGEGFGNTVVNTTRLTVPIKAERPHATSEQEPIAIVGMSVNMPGAASVSQLWEVLEQGINTIAEIPEHRFMVSNYDKATHSERKMNTHSGNFVKDAAGFDNKFFKISPREAKSMDPQQRILLHTAYEALEDSGYVPNTTPTSRPENIGCYIGVTTHDYLQNLRNDIDVYYSTGTLKAFLSGRISYAMQLSGPSIVVDTASSSSSVALYQAVRALANKDCDAALIGGINIITSPDMFLGLDKANFLSPGGQCKTFDASADGYSRGEGCGMFVLKRLSDAIAENDHIRGLIRGIEVNQNGLAHSITRSHAPTQSQLFSRLLQNTGVHAHRINVVEAHGTGTQADDPSEVGSIRSVFAKGRSASNPLHITSINGNIGHLEAASGAAGLAKLILMLQHKVVPKQISLKNLNPQISPLDSDNIVIDTTGSTWASSQEGMPRMALLNNSGAAGSNAAVLLEEYQAHETKPSPSTDMSYVFGFSAKDDSALEELRSNFLRWVQTPEAKVIPLANIAYTATARRQIYDSRLAIAASTRSELIAKLGKASIGRPGVVDPAVIFLFSGRHGQHPSLGPSLYQTSPLFKGHIDECRSILKNHGFSDMLPIITFGEKSGPPPEKDSGVDQVTTFSLEYALAKLWVSWGVIPSAVIGHGLGEYVALVVANVLSLRDALLIIVNRARLHTSISLRRQDPSIPPISDELLHITKRVKISPPTILVASHLTGKLVSPGDASLFTCEYLARYDIEPAEFHRGVESLMVSRECEATIWIEIGPPSHLPGLEATLPPNTPQFRSLLATKDPWTTLSNNLALLYSMNVDIHWREVFSHLPFVTCASLPTYPFRKTQFWVPFVEENLPIATPTQFTAPPSDTTIPHSPMLHSWLQYPSDRNDFMAIFTTPIKQLEKPISGHNVAGVPLCPASVYLEQILAGINLTMAHLGDAAARQVTSLRNIEFKTPLIYDRSIDHMIYTSVKFSKGSGTFTITSKAQASSDEVLHVRGEYQLRSTAQIVTKLSRALPPVTRRLNEIVKPKDGKPPETFSTRTAYNVVFPRVVDYAKEYHTVQSLVVDSDGMAGHANVKLPADYDKGKFVVHPVFMDTLLHVAGFIANLYGSINDAYICTGIGTVTAIPELVDNDASYTVYSNNSWLEHEGIMLTEVYAVSQTSPKHIVAHLKGVAFRRVRLASLTRMLTHAGKVPLARTTPEIATQPPQRPSPPKPFPRTRDSGNEEATYPGGNYTQTSSSGTRTVSGSSSPHTLALEDYILEPTELDIDGEPNAKPPPAATLDAPLTDISNGIKFKSLGLNSKPNKPKVAEKSLAASQGHLSRIAKALRLDTVPIVLQKSQSRTALPLFLIHDGSGLVNYYDRLSPLDRNIWGIHNPHFITAQPWDSVIHMATEYARLIEESTRGPVILGGWSFGGVAAYETSLQLAKKGIHVQGILLIDSPSPINHVPLSDSLIDSVVNLDARSAASELGRLVKTQFAMNARMLGRYSPHTTGGPCPPLVMLRSSEGYNPPGVADVPIWLADRSDPHLATVGWEELAKASVKILDIPGHHFQPFHPSNIGDVSQRIMEGCAYLESL
ncbi:beta-ketoacyl synthase [Infundibulicybe gibba]|nr:beta-ketoacyl synthase [Infundibulicybe gibba]